MHLLRPRGTGAFGMLFEEGQGVPKRDRYIWYAMDMTLMGTALLCEMYQMYLSLLVPWNACRPLK